MRNARSSLLASLVLLGAVALSCSRRTERVALVDAEPAPSVATLRIAGSTALLPFATLAANTYMTQHPNVAIQVEAGGSLAGLARVAEGGVDIGASDVAPEAEASARLEDHKVAVVGFAVVAKREPFSEPVTSLTTAQLRGIFQGQIRDWSEIGGKPHAIIPVNRGKSSGTRAAFAHIVLGGDHFAPGMAEEESSAQVQTRMLQTPGSISYLAMSYPHHDLLVLAVDGVMPSAETIEHGQYPIWSFEHMYTLGAPSPQAASFIAFLLSPPMQGEPLLRTGFIPVAAMAANAKN